MIPDSNESIFFKLRFNTAHGATDLFWRVIINDEEYLVKELRCSVPTFSDASYDKNADMIKYHIAGWCTDFSIGEDLVAIIK